MIWKLQFFLQRKKEKTLFHENMPHEILKSVISCSSSYKNNTRRGWFIKIKLIKKS